MSSNHSRQSDTSKTISRKAQNKALQSALLGSTTSTPADSRAGSNNATDVEESEEDSILGDLDDQLTPDEVSSWQSILNGRIEDILEWKRSSTAGREMVLRQYVRILQQRYAEEEISEKEQDLVLSFLKSIKQASSDAEVEFALKALEMTSVTSGLESMFEDCGPRIKRTIEDDGTSVLVRVSAIQTYAVLAIFSGAENEDLLGTLEFLLELITEEELPNNAETAKPIIAAMEAYALLATYVEDISDYSTDHVEVLLEPLDSSIPAMQVAAANAIALLFEKSYSPPEKDEVVDTNDKNNVVLSFEQQGEIEEISKPVLIKRYDAARNRNRVLQKLETLTSRTISARRGKHVKAARQSLQYALSSIQNPDIGPMYQQSLGYNGSMQGSKLRIRISAEEKITIDKWWKYFRVFSLRQCLQSGFMMHYEQNPLIDEMASVLLD